MGPKPKSTDGTRSIRLQYLFTILLTVLFLAFLIGFVRDSSGDQANVYFLKTEDYMADYYNVAKYSSDRDPYLFGQGITDANRAYFPFTYVLFFPLSKLADYKNLSAFDAGRSNMGLATSAFFMFATAALFFLLLYESSKVKKKRLRVWITICMMLSWVMIYAYERGTTMILAAMLSAFFLLNYNNPDRVTKELSFLALAAAAALKGIPAMLGVLLLYEKRWTEAVRLAVYGAVMVFAPFLFVKGGFGCISQLRLNLAKNSYVYSDIPYRGLNFNFWRAELLSLGESFYAMLLRRGLLLAHYGILLLALISAPFQTTRWKKLSLLLFAVALFSRNNGDYWALFLLPGMMLFFNEEAHPSADYLYLLAFLLILNPYQMISAGGFNFTSALRNLASMACFVGLTADAAKRMVRSRFRLPNSKPDAVTCESN